MARAITSLLGLTLLGLSIVFAFFIILSGVTDHTPLNKTYFLEADTSGIHGAKDLTRWTYLRFCGDGNHDCTKSRPAPAFGKAWDANANAPSQLVGSHGGDTTSSYYFYMWRFGWVFFLIALFFSVLAFFTGLFLSCCGRIGAFLSATSAFLAMVFWTLAAVFMTVVFVKARNHFRDDGRDAHLGPYAFGWAWGGWAATFIATVLFCLGTRKSKKDRYPPHPPRRTGGVETMTVRRRRWPFGGRRTVDKEYA
ncbi:related to FMP45 Cell cortex protein involved in sporulation [Cephalotrichum gorgonifer]|uniref:Related to FMP45 Cell cortex protein involved in sporulation n=1 Tax=Cephalotrichum gorgonifer TaxID=2041049 RepID=A0AAE8STM9_9PEZI|nr:related to FMP45 Cell cortex protein involved in sporulation [Cephalotrichum gorgonifer]